MSRLPVHPRPVTGEALSSWLARLARTYKMSPAAFVDRLVGHAVSPNDIDRTPPSDLVEAIESATGIPSARVLSMTVAGTLEAAARRVHPSSVGTILIPSTMRVDTATPWGHQWRYSRLATRVCAICFHEAWSERIVRLAWRLPIVGSCVRHGANLSLADGLSWHLARPAPINVLYPDEAPAIARLHDRRVVTALAGGRVQLSRGAVSGDEWIGGLHRLLDELTQPALIINLPTDGRDDLGLTASFRRWAQGGGIWGQALERAHFPMQAMVTAAVSRVAALIGEGLLLAPGCGPVATALRPSSFAPAPERMRLTYLVPLPPDTESHAWRGRSLGELLELISAPGYFERAEAYQKSRRPRVFRI